MSLEVIQPLGDDVKQAELMPKLSSWYRELKAVLPKLPVNLQIYFVAQDDPLIMEEFGVGGYAYSPSIMSLGFDLDFQNKEEQLRQLKGTVYHEGLHIAQGYTGSGEQTPLIECCVYEGLATVFEREALGMRQPYGEYPDDETALHWLEQIKAVTTPWTWDDYSRWGFYDESDEEKWKLYKAGTWLIDQVVNQKNLTVQELTGKSAREILDILES